MATSLRKAKHRLPARVQQRLSRRTVVRVVGSAEQPFMKASFAQLGEDLIVRYLFEDLGIPAPSYLDIGAHHPFDISNTALLHLSGSAGINIEPDPDLIEAFRTHRPDAVNLNVGIAAESGELTFHRMSVPGLSTFSAEAAAEVVRETGGRVYVAKTFPVPVLTVPAVLTEHFGGRCPDFLSLDVEGLDEEILATLPTWPGRPTVICVETTSYSIHGRGRKNQAVVDGLLAQGYLLYADTFANSIFVLRERFQR